MSTTIRVLMIDDHPLQIEGYKTVLNYNEIGKHIEVVPVYDSFTAYQIITAEMSVGRFDLVFLDWSLPPYEEMDIISGEDLAELIKKHMPQTKIMLMTSHSESFLLYGIVRNIDPAGLVVKSDFTADDLLEAFEEVLAGKTYYSATVANSIKELTMRADYLDSINREIITLLSLGVQTKNIPGRINLSKSTVEKRKVLIKEFLGIDKGNDEDIVREARKMGFI
jgi:DNA-binding NarL/FixJ family response regulator